MLYVIPFAIVLFVLYRIKNKKIDRVDVLWKKAKAELKLYEGSSEFIIDEANLLDSFEYKISTDLETLELRESNHGSELPEGSRVKRTKKGRELLYKSFEYKIAYLELVPDYLTKSDLIGCLSSIDKDEHELSERLLRLICRKDNILINIFRLFY